MAGSVTGALLDTLGLGPALPATVSPPPLRTWPPAPGVMAEGTIQTTAGGWDRSSSPNPRLAIVAGPECTLAGMGAGVQAMLAAISMPAHAVPDIPTTTRALVAYNAAPLGVAATVTAGAAVPALPLPAWQVGAVVTLPVECALTGGSPPVTDLSAWSTFAAAYDPAWDGLLDLLPAPLAFPDNRADAAAAAAQLAAAATVTELCAPVRGQLLAGPSAAIFPTLALLQAIDQRPAPDPIDFATTLVTTSLQADELALLATLTPGAIVLRALYRRLAAASAAGAGASTDAAIAALNAALGLPSSTAADLTSTGPSVVAGEPATSSGWRIRGESVRHSGDANGEPNEGWHELVLGRAVYCGPVITCPGRFSFTGPAYIGTTGWDAPAMIAANDGELNPGGGAGLTLRLKLVGAIAGNEHFLDAVRLADPGLASLGVQQWSADHDDELTTLLYEFAQNHPDEFDSHFGVYGLGLALDTPGGPPTGVTLMSIPAGGTAVALAPAPADDSAVAIARMGFFGGYQVTPHTFTFIDPSDDTVRTPWAARMRNAVRSSHGLVLAELQLAAATLRSDPRRAPPVHGRGNDLPAVGADHQRARRRPAAGSAHQLSVRRRPRDRRRDRRGRPADDHRRHAGRRLDHPARGALPSQAALRLGRLQGGAGGADQRRRARPDARLVRRRMDGRAVSVAELEAEILDVATALGVVSAGRLNGDFFEDPPSSLRTILQSAQQRAALLDALDRLMTADDPIVDGATTITRHPLAHNATGTVAISIERSGSASDPTVIVGLWATAAQAQGYAVEVDLPLVQGVTAGLSVVAASAEHPLAVSASVPIGWDLASHPIGLQSASLSALVVASDLGASRIALELKGLDVGAGPSDLALDPANVESELAHVLISLLRAGLAAAGTADATVQALLDHLPGVLGIDGELPLLPLGELASDAGAFRAWIGSLLTATVDGRPALVHWLDQLGQLLGAPALAATLTQLPDITDPLQIPIVAGGDGAFALTILAYVANPAASTTPELHVSISGGIGADVAAVRAEAELLVVPLGGNTATQALTMAQIVAESTGPLWPRAGATDDELHVGVARGGLRYDGTHVIPILELDDVFVALPAIVGDPITFDRLDLTNAKTIAAEASQKVSDVLTGAIGANAVAEAVLGLIGLSAPTPTQLAAFANDPLRAIGALHRGLLDAGTYEAMAQQIAALFGITAPVAGSGTAADPWFAPLTGVTVTAGSTVGVGIAIWDVPGAGAGAGGHELHLGLRLATPPAARPGWSLSLAADLLTISLPASATAHAGLLGAITLATRVRPPAADDAHVTADHLALTAGWSPGSPLRVDASIADVEVNVDGTAVTVGDIALPDGLTHELIDGAWDAVRAILDRAAAAWGQSAGAVVSALLGLGAGIGGLPATWPALTAPPGGIAALLSDPLELLRTRLAAIVTAAAGDLGEVPLLSALELVSGLIGGRLPAAAQPALGPLPNGPPITGDGTYERPLALALTDPSTPLIAQPIELIAWLEPGVPAAWAQSAQAVLGADSRLAATALGELGSWLPAVSDALTGVPNGDPGPWLAALGAAVDGTDGLASADVQAALPTGAIAADPVVAAHHLAPQSTDAVAAVAAHLQAHAAGAPIVLLAPSFAASDVWSPLLTELGVASTATVNLDVPGVSPDAVDLGAVTKADAYIVQLADDGTATLAVLATRLQRVVARIQTLAGSTTNSTGVPSVKVSLVGHSTAGVVALQYAGARAVDCQAITTIAAPLTPIDPARTLTGDMASGVRLLRALAPARLTATPALDAVLGHLQTALDGCVGGAPAPYPVAAFARALPTGASVGTIPTLVVPAVLESTIAAGLAGALAAGLSTQTSAATAPTHLCWGLRAGLAVGTAAAGSGPEVDVRARLDLGRVALTKGAADPPAPKQRVAISATVSDPSGWLVGSGGTGAALDARLRAAEITFTAAPGAPPGFDVTLYDAAVRGIGGPRLSLADVQAPELLNGLAGALAKATAGTPAASLLQALEAIGLASFDAAAQTAAFYADAIAAVLVDPAAFLRDRLITGSRRHRPRAGLDRRPGNRRRAADVAPARWAACRWSWSSRPIRRRSRSAPGRR